MRWDQARSGPLPPTGCQGASAAFWRSCRGGASKISPRLGERLDVGWAIDVLHPLASSMNARRFNAAGITP